MKSKWVWALFAMVLSAGIWGGTLMATNPSGLGTTTLAKSRFDEINVKAQAIPASIWKTKIRTHGLSDVYVVDNKLAPVDPNTGAVANTGWHSHPGPSLIFVVGGTVTNYTSEDRKCTGQKYSAGQGFIDSGKDLHILRNEGSVLAETIAVQLLAANTPSRRIDQPAPGNCPF